MNSISFNPYNNSEEDNIIHIFIVEKNQGKEHLAQGHNIWWKGVKHGQFHIKVCFLNFCSLLPPYSFMASLVIAQEVYFV